MDAADAVATLAQFDAVIDARSPAEFAEDRLPGAINLPVLDNEERRIVGSTYTQVSALEARKVGAVMAARRIAEARGAADRGDLRRSSLLFGQSADLLRSDAAGSLSPDKYSEELAETARLGMKLGANPLTLMGLAGLGDLVATCSSPLSRNRSFGERLGQGMTTEEIYAGTKQVAEGAKSCSSLRALAEQNGCDAPVARYVDGVVAGHMTAQEMMDAVLARDTKAGTD